MHFRYMVLQNHHIVVRETDGTVIEDTRLHIVVQPVGSKVRIDIPRSMLLPGCSIDIDITK